MHSSLPAKMHLHCLLRDGNEATLTGSRRIKPGGWFDEPVSLKPGLGRVRVESSTVQNWKALNVFLDTES